MVIRILIFSLQGIFFLLTLIVISCSSFLRAFSSLSSLARLNVPTSHVAASGFPTDIVAISLYVVYYKKLCFLLEENIITTANLAQSAFSSKTFLGRQNLMHFDKHKSRRVHNFSFPWSTDATSRWRSVHVFDVSRLDWSEDLLRVAAELGRGEGALEPREFLAFATRSEPWRLCFF